MATFRGSTHQPSLTRQASMATFGLKQTGRPVQADVQTFLSISVIYIYTV